jgi:hypothetical protein
MRAFSSRAWLVSLTNIGSYVVSHGVTSQRTGNRSGRKGGFAVIGTAASPSRLTTFVGVVIVNAALDVEVGKAAKCLRLAAKP